jgi:methyl-accepting chemotaxis protein
MPKDPLSAIVDGLQKVQKIHNSAEQIKQGIDRIDPLASAVDVLDNITQKVNEINSIVGTTKRRGRRIPPKE